MRTRKEKKTLVTLPVSDTVPAPGNYTVEVLNMDGDGLPVVNGTDLIDSIDSGAARDVSSTLQAPNPGRFDNFDENEPDTK